MKALCSQHKNLDNPSCMNRFFANSSKSFRNCLTLETGMSDFHKAIVTVTTLKVKRDKLHPT